MHLSFEAVARKWESCEEADRFPVKEYKSALISFFYKSKVIKRQEEYNSCLCFCILILLGANFSSTDS